ncbi:MAG: disulfide bond formation protein B [Pseudomonadota bacterium]
MTRHIAGPNWPLIAVLASLAMLAGAHAFETIGKMAPCPLCLRQRDIYWGATAMAVTGLVLWQRQPARRYLVALDVMLGLVFLTGVVVAGYHSGVEWGWWTGPAGCSGGGAGPITEIDLSAALDGRIATVSCTEAPWRMFGLSMAGYNTLVSAGLALISFIAASATIGPARSSGPGAHQLSSSTSQ